MVGAVERELSQAGNWAAANNVERAYVPFQGSWLNRIEAQFTEREEGQCLVLGRSKLDEAGGSDGCADQSG